MTGDQYGRPGDGPFCDQTWHRDGYRLLVCQRGPRHPAEGRPHKDVSGLLWSDEERAAGVLR
jgi:hypothetical protein